MPTLTKNNNNNNKKMMHRFHLFKTSTTTAVGAAFSFNVACAPSIFARRWSSSKSSPSPPSSSKLTIPMEDPADPHSDVHISNDGSVAALHDALNEKYKRRIFIRAAPSVGKSTLAEDYVRTFSADSVYISAARCRTEEDAAYVISRAILEKWPDSAPVSDGGFLSAVDWACKHGKTLVIDECHMLFQFPEVVSAVTKDVGSRVIFVSAASEVRDAKTGKPLATPVGIKSLFWRPPAPDFADLGEQLERADVKLEDAAVEFLWILCAAQRGIFMAAMQWVKEKQQQEPPTEAWSRPTAVSLVRADYGHEMSADNEGKFWGAIKNSRAVMVNGNYGRSLAALPVEYLQLLCGGPRKIGDSDVRRELIAYGFAQMQVRDAGTEFGPSGVDEPSEAFEPANGLLARYYRAKLEKDYNMKIERDAPPPPSTIPPNMRGLLCSSIVAHVLPYMYFSDVVNTPTQVSDGKFEPSVAEGTGLPDEVRYSGAMVTFLRSLLGHVDGYRDVYAVSSNNVSGSPDIVIPFNDAGRVIIEVVMHVPGGYADVVRHALRFLEKDAYRVGKHKGLVIFGRSRALCDTEDAVDTVGTLQRAMEKARVALDTRAMEKARDALDETNADHGVEIIGVLVAPDHTRYRLYVLPATLGDGLNRERTIFGPLELPCDMVSRRVVWSGPKLVTEPAQSYASSSLDHITEVIVTDGTSTFRVTPSHPDVMALKDAIKAKRAVRYAHIDADEIIIKLPDGSKPGDEDSLRGNIKYKFEVPK